MIDKSIQLLVGPTTLPNRVMKAMNFPAISHRGQYYYDVQHEVSESMKKIFKTKNDVLTLTSSGTGAMEAVIQNLFNPGDKVIMPLTGEFGKLFYNVAEPYGLNIIPIQFEYGETADVGKIMKYVTDDVKAVLLVHNESSTGILNDIEELGKALQDKDTLLVVDSVSAAAGVNIEMDNWGIDVVITASQKSLMAPPGLSFVSLSDAAWRTVEKVNNQRYYFNFMKDRKYINEDRTVHTPATHTLLAVREALRIIDEEGLENVYQRHIENANYVRKELKRMGLKLIAKDEKYCSPTLTCVYTPEKAKFYISELKKRNIIVGGGKSPLDQDTFRIGTMGYVSKNDVVSCMKCLEDVVNLEKE